jgi:hypothetical protein
MGTKSVGSSKTNSGSGSSSTITTATTKWGHIPLSYTRVNNIRTMISLSKNKIGKGRECYRYYCRISRENQTTVEVDQDQRVYPTSICRACRSTGSNTTAKPCSPLGRHSCHYFFGSPDDRRAGLLARVDLRPRIITIPTDGIRVENGTMDVCKGFRRACSSFVVSNRSSIMHVLLHRFCRW